MRDNTTALKANKTLYNTLDSKSNEWVTFNEATVWTDGTAMDDTKCDGVLFKKGPDGIYYRRNYSRWASVKWWGAKGDGVTNDTVAIDNAIQTIKATGYGTLYFPRGKYLVDKVTLRHRVSIQGDGINSTVFIPTLQADPGVPYGLFEIEAGAVRNINVQDFTVWAVDNWGVNATPVNLTQWGFYIQARLAAGGVQGGLWRANFINIQALGFSGGMWSAGGTGGTLPNQHNRYRQFEINCYGFGVCGKFTGQHGQIEVNGGSWNGNRASNPCDRVVIIAVDAGNSAPSHINFTDGFTAQNANYAFDIQSRSENVKIDSCWIENVNRAITVDAKCFVSVNGSRFANASVDFTTPFSDLPPGDYQWLDVPDPILLPGYTRAGPDKDDDDVPPPEVRDVTNTGYIIGQRNNSGGTVDWGPGNYIAGSISAFLLCLDGSKIGNTQQVLYNTFSTNVFTDVDTAFPLTGAYQVAMDANGALAIDTYDYILVSALADTTILLKTIGGKVLPGKIITLKILGTGTLTLSNADNIEFPQAGVNQEVTFQGGNIIRLQRVIGRPSKWSLIILPNLQATAMPANGAYYARGSIIRNSTPTPATPSGWVCTTAGLAGSTAVFALTYGQSTNTQNLNAALPAGETWDGTAPATRTLGLYSWIKNGQMVQLTLQMSYTTQGATNTQVDIVWPADLPLPLDTFSTANDILYVGKGQIAAANNAPQTAGTACIIKLSSGVYKITVKGTSVGAKSVWGQVNYVSAS